MIRFRRRAHRTMIVWLALVAVAYACGTLAIATHTGLRSDRPTPPTAVASPAGTPAPSLPTVPIQIAKNLLHGDVALDSPPGGTDTVTRDGRSYDALSIGPILPYLLFAPFPGLWEYAPWVITFVVGVGTAALCWPLAASYGPGGRTTVWLATLGAVGTLLLPLAVMGNYYYLAHEEAMLLTIVALLELNGRRRPWVVGLTLGLATLARPTVILAVAPIGLFLVLGSRSRVRSALGFALPVVAAIGVMGWYNFARFGSPFDSGYATSILHNQTLIRARRQGLFSIRHVGANLQVLVAGGFQIAGSFPYVIPSSYGHSMLLTTPALLAAIGAGFRDRLAVVLWLSAAVVTVPLLLYYGGAGYQTYGYRYFLDATPFLLALVAIAARRHFGKVEKSLVVLSVAFCAYGVLWGAFNGHF